MLEIITQDGKKKKGAKLPDLSQEDLLGMYKLMVLSRTMDLKLAAMNLQGRIASYYKIEGQEGHVGAAWAMGKNDFLYPAYREMAMWLKQGLSLETVFRFWKGTASYDWDSEKHKIATVTTTIGTQITHATGHAYAAKLKDTDEVVVCSLGDGSTSTPDFHAGLNFAGVLKAPVVFFIQNNQWTEETPVSKQTATETLAEKAGAYGFKGIRVHGQDVLAVYQAMKEAIENARKGNGPTIVEMLTYRYSPHMVSAIDPRPAEEKEKWYAMDPLERFQNYLKREGLLTDELEAEIATEASQRVEDTVDMVEEAQKSEGLPGTEYLLSNTYEKPPQTLVEQTNQWARWSSKPEVNLPDSEIWKPGPEVLPGGETKKLCVREALNTAIDHAMHARPETVITGIDVSLVGGQFRVTADMLDKYSAERVIDTPLSEMGIIGSAIGMANNGLRPVAEIMFAGFTFTAIDNIITHLARWRFRYQGERNLPVVVRLGHGSGVGGHECHIDSTETYFMHSPGLTVVFPSNPVDAKGLMAAALESEDPVIFFEPMLMYNAPQEEVPVEHYTIPLGKAKVCTEGSDVTLVTYGLAVPHALQAAQASPHSVEVIDLRTIKPWDEDTVVDSVKKTGRLVVVSEAPRSAGVASEIVATVMEKAGFDLEVPPLRVAGLDAPRPTRMLEQLVLIRPGQIGAAIEQVMSE